MIRPWTRALALLAAMALVAALLSACDGDSVPNYRPPPNTPPAGTVRVSITVPGDEIVLDGTLFGQEHEAAVLLAHMRPSDESSWFPFAAELAERGYAALTLNFRGYGDSGGDQDFDKLDEDLEAALAYLRGLGKQRVFLMGASMGGTAALVVGARDGNVEAVVAISAPERFEEQDALAAVAASDVPVLLLASEEDTAAILSLDELLAAARGPVESAVYAGNAHGTDLFEGEHAVPARERIFLFLEELGGP